MIRIHLGLGRFLREWGLVAMSIDAYRDAVRAEPASFEARCALGEALARGGRWDEAADVFRSAIALRPADVEAQGCLVLALHRLGRARESAGAMRRLVDLRPGERDLHLVLGVLQCRAGRPWEAIRTFRWAARLSAAPALKQFLLGEALFGERRWTDLRDQLEVASPRASRRVSPVRVAAAGIGTALLDVTWHPISTAARTAVAAGHVLHAHCVARARPERALRSLRSARRLRPAFGAR